MTVKKVSDTMTGSINRIQKDLRGLPKEAYDFWIKKTPKRTGNARSKTRLERDTIAANYDYAQALDSGTSRQAPKGMSDPTTDFLDSKIRNIMRK
jgi:hypothetical protein